MAISELGRYTTVEGPGKREVIFVDNTIDATGEVISRLATVDFATITAANGTAIGGEAVTISDKTIEATGMGFSSDNYVITVWGF